VEELKNGLGAFYNENGLLDLSPMHSCINSISCWMYIKESRKINSDWGMYYPYIGGKYQEARILVTGINMNGFGDPNAEDLLVKQAIKEISEGKKRTFAKEGYRGSLLWHRLLSYSVYILREINILPKNDRPYPTIRELQTAIDYISVTNSIKCSPNDENSNDNSRPSYEMWNNCPKFILKKEIEILKPKYLIVLGKLNFSYLKNLFNVDEMSFIGEVKSRRFYDDTVDFCAYGIPHPSSSMGTSIIRMDEFEKLLIGQFGS